MDLDVTLQEVNIWRSVKKFFYDALGSSLDLFFDRISTSASEAKYQKWVCVTLDAMTPGQVTDIFMNVYMYTTEDNEGDNLVQLKDTIMDLLYPGYIDLYDTSVTPWVKIGSMLVYIPHISRIFYNPDRTTMKYIQCQLKWPSVWS